MNYLNENIIAQNVANNVITSPFGMGEGFFKQSDYYSDLNNCRNAHRDPIVIDPPRDDNCQNLLHQQLLLLNNP